MKDLRNLTYEQARELCVEMGDKPFRAQQIFSWLYKGKSSVQSIGEMGNLPAAFREQLMSDGWDVGVLRVLAHQMSEQDGTEKYLFELEDGNVIHPEQVLGHSRKGVRFSFITDTMYLGHIAKHVENSDLILCEGMFTRDLSQDAFEKKHMTSTQAAMIARDANAKKLGLIHYSPRYTDKELQLLKQEACEVFENTVLCRDRYSFLLSNPD